MATQADDSLGSTYLFTQLDSYPWDDDQEFQGGLSAILGSVKDPAQVEHLTLRAKCYYYARKAGTHVDFDGYKRWVELGGQEEGTNGLSEPGQSELHDELEETGSGDGGMVNAPKPASFAEICDMIAEGKPIPGIKDIPETILEGQASESQTSRRKKPWEKDASGGAEKPSWMTRE
ncbi:hypothetical protein LTR36_000261 [Oleoguttula mirabilis]|uniref:Uncharacterized protein n=1 Tax=Oleoguttula mirabilis TaxID=1507867 RepID=A0AAV9JZS4_9PEZI|nr:hypothetical protein LTR36_000261 [Oleoguttula mirabilis]